MTDPIQIDVQIRLNALATQAPPKPMLDLSHVFNTGDDDSGQDAWHRLPEGAKWRFINAFVEKAALNKVKPKSKQITNTNKKGKT